MIGKLGETGTKGRRDQGDKELVKSGRIYFDRGGLTTGTSAPGNRLSDAGFGVSVLPLQQFNHKLQVVAVLQRLVPKVSDCSLLMIGQRLSLELAG